MLVPWTLWMCSGCVRWLQNVRISISVPKLTSKARAPAPQRMEIETFCSSRAHKAHPQCPRRVTLYLPGLHHIPRDIEQRPPSGIVGSITQQAPGGNAGGARRRDAAPHRCPRVGHGHCTKGEKDDDRKSIIVYNYV